MGYLKKERQGARHTFMLNEKMKRVSMGKIIAVHIQRRRENVVVGEFGATFAKQGKKVCLFDLDFRAPSLFAILKLVQHAGLTITSTTSAT
jgi:hypothetical protein